MDAVSVVNLIFLGLYLLIIALMGLVMLAWRFHGRDPSWFFRPWVAMGEWVVDVLDKLPDPPGWS